MESVLSLWKKFPNQDLLGFAATSFLLFFISELIAAFVSGSLSLLADAVAM
jgi:Co/Zn/Cd efflux system component